MDVGNDRLRREVRPERQGSLNAAMVAQGAHKMFQTAKPTSSRCIAPEPVKPVRKPHARKAPAAKAAK